MYGARWEVILIHDQKDPEPAYEGQIVGQPQEVFDAVTDEATPPLTFVVRKGSPDDTASTALALAKSSVKTALVLDEQGRAVNDAGTTFTSPVCREVLLEGRSRGVSYLGASPTVIMPNLCWNMSTVFLFNPGRKNLDYLLQNRAIEKGMIETVANLRVIDVPGAAPPPGPRFSEFIVVEQDRDWNGIVYELRLGGGA
jgi:hypothetical protein